MLDKYGVYMKLIENMLADKKKKIELLYKEKDGNCWRKQHYFVLPSYYLF